MVGNLSNFHKLDIVRLFFDIKEPKSRIVLTDAMKIGEGTLRTILDILKDKGYAKSTTKGHVLSKKGNEIYDELAKYLSAPEEIKLKTIYPDMAKRGMHVKSVPENSLEKDFDFVRLRDVAVKNGAEGALIFQYKDKLTLPLHKGKFPVLERDFEFNAGDLLVVAISNDEKWADIGSLAICCEIVPKLKAFYEEF